MASDCEGFRFWLRSKGIIPCIPPHRSRKSRRKSWEEGYRKRWVVERTFAWLDNFRRLVVRWERLQIMYEAFLTPSCILICLRVLLK